MFSAELSSQKSAQTVKNIMTLLFSDIIYPELKKWKLKCPSKRIVFPNRKKKMFDRSARIFQEQLQTVLKNAGFQPKYITFHSLRHTFASHWVMNHGDLFKLQKILGHSSSDMTQRYAHLKPDAYKMDWNIFGDATEQGKVIELCSKAGKR